jgi:hypothetical protein
MEPPRIMALMTSAAILSNKSAPRAAQSPTLSPTCIGRQGVKHSSVHRKYLKDCRENSTTALQFTDGSKPTLKHKQNTPI